ncbi:MAG: type II toxin-antitoxin system HigB family toxin [Gammaproteobacteria bacterium]|nr:type II toxin-antitoxin system HigB family toxin [Gammaproteobacteria bacterium]
MWLDVFNRKPLSFESSSGIRETWSNASGWNVDRIPARKLKPAARKGPLDIYVFDVHKTKCRIVAWGSPKAHTFFIKQVCSHAEYDKWLRDQIKP